MNQAAFLNLVPSIAEKPLPVVFLGHGSPMNAIEDNEFHQGWRRQAMANTSVGAVRVCPLVDPWLANHCQSAAAHHSRFRRLSQGFV